ncbi:MAG: hypothetical protein CO080_09385 [Nitrospirae bacterium CG_4_9_14_0_8_um_filter_70_14]|nr:MAG: hypothetical protein CO080_09385 [Nitrospirae bacterium CG_4_9_14_0_8_um_filter_70_14]
MRTPLSWMVTVVGVASLAGPARAELALDWSGFVTGAYTFNVNEPADDTNHGRVFDTEDNTFQVPLAELAVGGAVDAGPGFNLVLNFGDVADTIHSTGLVDDVNGFDIQQANVTYKGFTFGKFATLHGAEVIESPSNMNYSRSYLFGFAIPFTHTGLLYATEVGGIGLKGAVVNGWDNFEDNNDSKSLMAMVAVPLGEKGSVSAAGMYGAEQAANEGDMRGLLDLVASFSPSERVDLLFNFDYGSEEHAALDGGDGVWWGAAAYADVMLTELFGVAGRAEFFSDRDGARGLDTDVWEATVTGHQAFGESMTGRLEARYDQAADDLFMDGDGSLTDSQFTLATEVIVRFP